MNKPETYHTVRFPRTTGYPFVIAFVYAKASSLPEVPVGTFVVSGSLDYITPFVESVVYGPCHMVCYYYGNFGSRFVTDGVLKERVSVDMWTQYVPSTVHLMNSPNVSLIHLRRTDMFNPVLPRRSSRTQELVAQLSARQRKHDLFVLYTLDTRMRIHKVLKTFRRLPKEHIRELNTIVQNANGRGILHT